MSKTSRIFIVPDLHCDDHDPKAVYLAAQLCEAFKPNQIIFLGDVIDAYWASSYPTDPSLVRGGVKRELDAWGGVRNMFKAPVVWRLRGNHEQRIIRNWSWLAPAFGGLEDEIFRGLLHGAEVPPNNIVELAEGSLVVVHGNFTSKNSKELEFRRYGTSGISGHTHKLSQLLQRDYRQLRSWTECGHLQRNPPQYGTFDKPGPQDWAQGVAVVHTEGNQFHVETIPFTLSYHSMLCGKRYSA